MKKKKGERGGREGGGGGWNQGATRHHKQSNPRLSAWHKVENVGLERRKDRQTQGGQPRRSKEKGAKGSGWSPPPPLVG